MPDCRRELKCGRLVSNGHQDARGCKIGLAEEEVGSCWGMHVQVLGRRYKKLLQHRLLPFLSIYSTFFLPHTAPTAPIALANTTIALSYVLHTPLATSPCGTFLPRRARRADPQHKQRLTTR